MPYRDSQKQREAMRAIMRNYRKAQREALQVLQLKYPSIYDEIFGLSGGRGESKKVVEVEKGK